MSDQVNDIPVPSEPVQDPLPQEVPEPAPMTYAEAFPSLGGSSAAPARRAQGQRPRIRAVQPRKTTTTAVVEIPKEEQRFSATEKSRGGSRNRVERFVSEIAVKHRVQIKQHVNRAGSLVVRIEGKPDAVVEAKKQVLSRLQTQASIEIDIPKEHHRYIIGPEGSNLKALSAKYAVRVFMPKNNEASQTIKIVGTAVNCRKAAQDIQHISFERAKTDHRKLQISKAYHPLVAGPGNATIKRIMEQTGVKIHVPPPAVEKDEVTVTGERAAVARACDELMQIYNDKRESCGELTAEIPRTQHRFLIGPKGANLREINEKTGVVVEVPHPDKDDNTIILRGERANLVQALTLVYEFANKIVVKKLSVPQWLHKHVLGKKGENARKLREERPKVHIQFPKEGDEIEIEGPPEDVDVVRDSLRALADELQRTLTFSDVRVEPKYHPYIIGQSGSTINEIRAKSGATIDIPANNSGSDRVRVEGTPEAVAKAVSLVSDMATKLRNQKTDKVSVPSNLHSQIIGAGGDGLRKLLQGYDSVSLNFPDRGSDSEEILIRGDKKQVDAVIAAIKERVRDIEASNYSDTVHVFRKFHPDIIGKGGETINRIRNETNTRINVPAAEEENDYITIVGYKQDVEKAKQAILDIQQKVGKIVTETMEVDSKYHPTIRGTQNRIQQSLESELSVQITVPMAKEKSNTVTIRGPSESVAEAKKAIQRLACDEALNSTTLEFTAPHKYHRHLIGQRSATLKRLVEESGVIRLVFPPARAKKDKDLVLAIGSKDACEKAKQLVHDRVQELEKVVTEVVIIDPKFYSALRSRQFSRHLGESNNVSIRFPRNAEDAEVVDDKVVVRGPREGVATAIEKLKARVDELERSVTKEMPVKPSSIPSIMGSGGSNVQKVCADFSVDIDVPSREDRDQAEGEVNLKVTGLPENCDAALAALQELVPIEEEIEVPRNLHRFMIIDKENGIRAIQAEHKARIDIPRAEEESDKIVIRGLAPQVAAAKAALEANMQIFKDALRKTFSMTMEVHPEFHTDLIGKRGANVNALRKKFDVRIDFPRKGGNTGLEPNEIRLTGFEEDCKACADDITATVETLKSHVVKEIDIHHAVHGKIIGPRGSGVRNLQETYGVRINFPADKSSDVLTVTGPEDKVDECIDQLFLVQEENEDLIEDYQDVGRHAAPSRPKKQNKPKDQAFQVRDAPWQGSYPTLEAQQAQQPPQQHPTAQGPTLMGAWARK
ncbi:hypothetical protein PTSG_00962 [Salpingoeca rosetta]|uniref:K Homology domain-containing protein n=1 Tax=Salpingoeca rosetta (strain ATCC 50818 / BSB-021) TaxID=946362 RepID=F2TY00_SALR5|nr:uncharacterized protein PTSG_00962 [Salpingoeca rosetta]EGD76259.1 hypothetical protein PTSG_00962 [Salpingoeca rosetta]|eukprot:XP_004998434.1 hypothetical protein PTSG_00962 [Salpingoeca rosetta]